LEPQLLGLLAEGEAAAGGLLLATVLAEEEAVAQRWPAELSAGLPLARAIPLLLAQAVRVERQLQLTPQVGMLEQGVATLRLAPCFMPMEVAMATAAALEILLEGQVAEQALLVQGRAMANQERL